MIKRGRFINFLKLLFIYSILFNSHTMSETQNETPHKEEPNPQNESPVKSAVEKNSEVQNSHQRKDSEPNKDVISLFNFDPNCKDVYFLTRFA